MSSIWLLTVCKLFFSPRPENKRFLGVTQLVGESLGLQQGHHPPWLMELITAWHAAQHTTSWHSATVFWHSADTSSKVGTTVLKGLIMIWPIAALYLQHLMGSSVLAKWKPFVSCGCLTITQGCCIYLSTVSLDEQVSLHVVIFIQKCFKDAQVINVLFDEDVTWSHWEVSQAPPY